MLAIEYVDSSRFADVNRFYEGNGYRGGIGNSDTVIVAKESNLIVGAVRLCLEHDVIVLRGMQILRCYQRQSIGTRILKFCLPTLNRQLSYCVPYSHLTQFYNQVGFAVAKEDSLPRFLRDRLSSYRESGQDVVVMMRSVIPG